MLSRHAWYGNPLRLNRHTCHFCRTKIDIKNELYRCDRENITQKHKPAAGCINPKRDLLTVCRVPGVERQHVLAVFTEAQVLPVCKVLLLKWKERRAEWALWKVSDSVLDTSKEPGSWSELIQNNNLNGYVSNKNPGFDGESGIYFLSLRLFLFADADKCSILHILI